MRALGLRPSMAARLEVDANNVEREPLTVFPGPVESMLREPLGQLSTGTRLYGRIWTAKRAVVIRYYKAQQPDGEPLSICAVARMAGGQLEAKPGKYPGSAELQFSSAYAYVVEDFL